MYIHVVSRDSHVTLLSSPRPPTTDTIEPVELTTLRSHKVKFIACGDEHTAALTEVSQNTACKWLRNFGFA